MPASPYAKVLYRIDGGAPTSGAQTVAGNNVIQLLGENTSHWPNQLWEIYEYPTGFTCPSGWVTINGIYQSNALVPDPFTVLSASTWGKYLFRLTVDGGLLNGVYAGPGSAQPLVDITPGVQVLSPHGLYDVGWQEKNQFDANRQWVGELKKTLRAIEAAFSGFSGGAVLMGPTIVSTDVGTVNNFLTLQGGVQASFVVWIGDGVSDVDFSGFTNGTESRVIAFVNKTNNARTMTFHTYGGGSTTGNQLAYKVSTITCNFDEGVLFQYNIHDNKWQFIGSFASSLSVAGGEGAIQINTGGHLGALPVGNDGDVVTVRGTGFVTEPGVEVGGVAWDIQVQDDTGGLIGLSPGDEGNVPTSINGRWVSSPVGGSNGILASFTKATNGNVTNVTAVSIDISGYTNGTYEFEVTARADAGVDTVPNPDVVGMFSVIKKRLIGIRGGQVLTIGPEFTMHNSVVPVTTELTAATARITASVGGTAVIVQLDGEASTKMDWTGEVLRRQTFGVSGGGSWGGAGSGAYAPGSFNLSGWYRGPFSSVPLAGTASAGSSGSKSLDSGTAGVGTSVNSIASIDFNGTTNHLSSNSVAGNHLGITGYRIAFLVLVDTVSAAGSQPYQSKGIFSASNANWGVAIDNTSGGRIVAYHNDGAYKTATKTIVTGGWHAVDIVYQGSADSLTVYVDGVAGSATTGVTDLAVISAAGFNVGCNPDATQFFDGKILEIITMSAADGGLSQMNPADFINYVNNRYALSL